jgi:hypothetical protein
MSLDNYTFPAIGHWNMSMDKDSFGQLFQKYKHMNWVMGCANTVLEIEL